MSIEIDENGTIHLYQGDSGEIIVTGLDKSKSGEIYLAIQDQKRKLIGNEIKVVISNNEYVSFYLTPDFTDLLKVPENKPYEIYYYGIKFCDPNSKIEDTLFVRDSSFGDLNQIIVYPKKVSAI